MARTKKALVAPTSKSSDAEITKFLSAVNKKIRGYYGLDEEVGAAFSNKVQNILTFNRWKTGHEGYDEEKVELKDGIIPLRSKADKQNAVDWMRRQLKYQEDAAAKQTAQDPNYQRGKTVSESLASLDTISEKKAKVLDQILNGNGVEDTTLKEFNPETDKKRSWNALAKQAVINEMIARATESYDTTFSEDIDKLYDDEVANSDLIDRLRNERWDSSDLMEEVHVRSLGIETRMF